MGASHEPEPGSGAPDGPHEHRDLTDAERALEETDKRHRRAERHAIYNRARFHGLQIDPEVDFYPEVADRRPGDSNLVRAGFDLPRPSRSSRRASWSSSSPTP